MPELLHSDYIMKNDGVAIMGYLGGYRSSSTRIELVGVILSILSDIPVHLACESQSVVRRAQFYAEHLRTNDTVVPPGKPFYYLRMVTYGPFSTTHLEPEAHTHSTSRKRKVTPWPTLII